jgi:hypothetical protein
MESPEVGSASTAPIPNSIDWSHRLRLSLNGLRDRLRCREVADDGHTHYTRVLLVEAHLGQANVDKWSQEVMAEFDARVANLEDLVAQPPALPSPQTTPTAAVLQTLSGPDRRRWAEEYRLHESRSRLARQQAEVRARQRRELSDLRKQRAMTAASAAAALVLWQRDYERRAAVYTRARTGALGLKVTKSGLVPLFSPPQGEVRRAADGQSFTFTDQLEGAMP